MNIKKNNRNVLTLLEIYSIIIKVKEAIHAHLSREAKGKQF